MPEKNSNIFDPDISPATRVRSLALAHPSLAAWREVDVLIAGIDERTGPQTWGEGLSPTHLLFVVVEGGLELRHPAGDCPAGPGELLLVPNAVPKHLAMGRGYLRGLWFHVRDTAPWTHLRGNRPSTHPVAEPDLLAAAQERLLAETLQADAAALEVGSLLARLVRRCLERTLTGPEAPARRELRGRLAALWQAVDANPAHPWSVAELAGRLHMSPGHFHRVVRELQHTHPMALVTRLRLERAAALLRSSQAKVEHVAAAVGYRSPYAFSHAFQRHTGLRPGVFRRQ